jgi:hypothetical protein
MNQERPRPVRDTVQGPVTFAGALVIVAMWVLHTILDATIDPAGHGVLWTAIEYIVTAAVSTGLGALALWWSTRRAVTQAERFVTPVEDPYGYDAGGRLVRLEPVHDVGVFDDTDPPPLPGPDW